MNEQSKRPECFGVLELVFPMTEDGLRQSPEQCMECGHKTECLKAAVESGGRVKVEDEKVDRAYRAGRISFLERWARKKSLSRKRRKEEKGAAKS